MRSRVGGVLAAVVALNVGATPPGPVDSIEARVAECASCHGPDGNAVTALTPSLAAQPRVFLETQMILIREGLREIPAMEGRLDELSDPEITAIAEHYAQQPLRPAPGERRPAQFERGRAVAQGRHCASCHLPSYHGREQIPRLAGQREDYLLHSMTQLRDGTATGRDTIMAASLYGASDEDLRDLAHYLAQLD
jgi:cytochrome c553